MTNNLKWSQHVSSISGKARNVFGLIKRNFLELSTISKKTAYTTLVHPKLEYGCGAWDPHFKKDISSLNLCRGKQHGSVQTTTNLQLVLLGWKGLSLVQSLNKENNIQIKCDV